MATNKKSVHKNHFYLPPVYPKTENQKIALESDYHLVLEGSAGTGKSFLATYLALKSLVNQKVNKVVLIRSAVPTRDIGFLPGTLEEKAEVYEAPIREIVNNLLRRDDAYYLLKKNGHLEFLTTSFLRGVTLDNAFIIVDEIQNMTFHELDTIMTRIGENSRLIMCGDYYQSDIKDSGLGKFLDIINTFDDFEFVSFKSEDIVRSDIVKRYILAKEKYEKGRNK